MQRNVQCNFNKVKFGIDFCNVTRIYSQHGYQGTVKKFANIVILDKILEIFGK